MKAIEKIKMMNVGMGLQKHFGKPDIKQARIYCGTEEYVEFFETIISTLGLNVEYEVEDVDGELEIVIGGNVE